MIFALSPIWLQQIWLHISDPLVLEAVPIRTLFLFVTNLAAADLVAHAPLSCLDPSIAVRGSLGAT